MQLYDSVSVLKGVGKKRIEQLEKAGISTVYDLLTCFPRAYEDWSRVYTIAGAPLNTNVCIRAYVGSAPREHYIRKGMTTYRLDITDGETVMDVVFFNNKYAARALELDKEYYFFGKIMPFGRGYRSMTSPRFAPAGGEAESLRPIYPQTGSLTSSVISKLILQALDGCTDMEDCLPACIRNDYCLMSFEQAINNIHRPESPDMLEEAKRRYIFEELFTLQVGLTRLKTKARRGAKCVTADDRTGEFISSLPFELTSAQKRAIKECSADTASGTTMNRLIQGDVGSGKTAVAAAVIYNCIRNGFQAALMAPTEVLAQQHFKSFLSFFEPFGISISLLTGSVSPAEKKEIKRKLASGETDFVIGTHALIQKDVEFKDLAIAVTDEQHRFGVNQRAMLNSKGDNPHVLVMSATPIPRTLSLIVYGDLDISILDEMPAGRQKIETYLIDGEKRDRAYGYVKKHLDAGLQGYVICPLVEDDGEEPDDTIKASKTLYKELVDGFFKGYSVGLLYGGMKPADKKDVMERFASGEINLLISTTVIEVGVDVPNAAIMVIENAERFGLSQLHQLRGRIGRGSAKSTCILISDNKDAESDGRLKILTQTADGFKIADEDLRLRGPGDIFGSRQHGLPEMKAAGFMTDGETVRETHIAAEKLLKNNPTLEGEEFNLFKKSVNRLFSKGISLN